MIENDFAKEEFIMQAYEFYAKVENGFIRVPEEYSNKIKTNLKVILLEDLNSKPTDGESNILKRTDALSPISIDTRGWKFDKEEANER